MAGLRWKATRPKEPHLLIIYPPKDSPVNKILVIDDDKSVLNYLKVFLAQARKFEVEVLSDST